MCILERNDSMQNNTKAANKKTFYWLVLIYIGSVVFRYIFALVTKRFPMVYIDEYLYSSLGRSIATKGSLLYAGQPAIYNYFIYPLFISPIYLLFGHGTNYFRAIQLWNILLMSLSVFPIYRLCNAIVQKQKTALWMTVLIMLLPCFILGEFVFSEAIIYPLFYTQMYCIYKCLKEDKVKYSIWTGVLGALLYYTKPGAVVSGVLALLLFIGKTINKKSGRNIVNALSGFFCLIITFFVLKLIVEQLLGYHGSLLSIYDYQSSFTDTISNEYFFRTVWKYPFYFIIASGIFPFLISVSNYSKYSSENKQFYLLVICCSMLTMIGTAWVANRPEKTEILYLRYVEMYLPVLYMFIMLPNDDNSHILNKSSRISNVICIVTLAYIIVCTAVCGSTTGTRQFVETHFLISLAVLFVDNIASVANIIIFILAALAMFLLVKRTRIQIFTRICLVIVFSLAIMNNIVGYISIGTNTSKRLEEETAEIHRMIGDKEYLHIRDGGQVDCGLDINSRQNISQIPESDFLNNLSQNQGVYTPFIPSSFRGMNATYETPDTDILIVDKKIYEHIKFSDNLSSYISARKNFKVIRFSKGQRLVDSIMQLETETNGNTKSAYKLSIYKEEWLSNPIMIRVNIDSPTEQEIRISADENRIATIKQGNFWYEIKTRNPVKDYIFSANDQNINICDYEITMIE